ncbi:MAG: LuxR C-terminal-related transcriptional regulator [Xanthobacteraceae bacterium]|jgi:DNA-binding NarL/FixJ family response regulator
MPTLQPANDVLGCTLTPREYEIATLASAALSNKEIARRLGVTEGTVKVHLHNIYQKAHVRNRTALTLRYHSNLILNGGVGVAGMV